MDHGQGNEFYWQEGARYGHDGWWAGPLHVIGLLLLLALLVVAVVWVVRRLQPGVAATTAVPAAMQPATLSADPAVAALRMRYARGEVSREDFQHTMEDLTGAPAPWPGEAGAEGDTAPTAS